MKPVRIDMPTLTYNMFRSCEPCGVRAARATIAISSVDTAFLCERTAGIATASPG